MTDVLPRKSRYLRGYANGLREQGHTYIAAEIGIAAEDIETLQQENEQLHARVQALEQAGNAMAMAYPNLSDRNVEDLPCFCTARPSNQYNHTAYCRKAREALAEWNKLHPVAEVR